MFCSLYLAIGIILAHLPQNRRTCCVVNLSHLVDVVSVLNPNNASAS
uniref:Uncharacterized protein n=1 Tax=Arundo donax TaxID=35708 RepID=A0A0A8Y7F6_ARUDO